MKIEVSRDDIIKAGHICPPFRILDIQKSPHPLGLKEVIDERRETIQLNTVLVAPFETFLTVQFTVLLFQLPWLTQPMPFWRAFLCWLLS